MSLCAALAVHPIRLMLLNPDREGVGECGNDTGYELRQVGDQLVLQVLTEGNQRVEDLNDA